MDEVCARKTGGDDRSEVWTIKIGGAMKTLFICVITFLLASMILAADTLDIYVVDTE
jgi:hypothetical protein